ncbi:Serine/threonine-protein kinase SRPK [Ceratocystis platani]|uniref:non-specific serine/threonine protein kinase n=1 Tax=Ceratocystis fimbriata f. sp. platani TaxID=88771 RepID=A0A0F8BX81_CERFI|nr:Serine/threonine-protein kinase SRPK [Ceratocystis platani]
MGSPETSNDSSVEEGCGVYHPGGFHPVYVGDIFNNRYHVLNKIGYGAYSTVWLVRDAQQEKGHEDEYLALKVLSAECYFTDHDIFEREILRHLRDGNTKLVGHSYICHLLDDFEHQGPNGTHVCLVFPLMGETLESFGAWFKNSLVPYSVMRRFTIQIVLALDYAHELGVIHTASYLQERKPPTQNRKEPYYTPIPSESLRCHYFTEEDGTRLKEFNVALGDWGVASWKTKHLSENIQPVGLRAPEVLIKAPWDTPTDWWNLGAVILEVYRAIRMFSGYTTDASGETRYELRKHLAEIVDFFGPFPKSLLDKGDPQIVKDIFCENGTVRGYPAKLNRPALASEEVMEGLEEEDREEFASFLRLMMNIDPDRRPEPVEVLKHPWLDAWRGS